MKIPPHARGGIFPTVSWTTAARGVFSDSYGGFLKDEPGHDSPELLRKLARWRVFATQACARCGAYYTIGRHGPEVVRPVAASPYCPRHTRQPTKRTKPKGRQAKK